MKVIWAKLFEDRSGENFVPVYLGENGEVFTTNPALVEMVEEYQIALEMGFEPEQTPVVSQYLLMEGNPVHLICKSALPPRIKGLIAFSWIVKHPSAEHLFEEAEVIGDLDDDLPFGGQQVLLSEALVASRAAFIECDDELYAVLRRLDNQMITCIRQEEEYFPDISHEHFMLAEAISSLTRIARVSCRYPDAPVASEMTEAARTSMVALMKHALRDPNFRRLWEAGLKKRKAFVRNQQRVIALQVINETGAWMDEVEG